MKKIMTILLVLLVAIGASFAATPSRWSVGASFGTASMVERTFNDGDMSKQANAVGIGADVRVDYEVVDTVAVTGVVGWEMPDRTFLVYQGGFDATEHQQHYVSLMVGVTKSKLEMDGANENDIDWSITLGPQLWVNATQGKFGGGATMIVKGAYFIANNVSLDLMAKVSALGIKDGPATDDARLFTDLSIKAGCTYRF